MHAVDDKNGQREDGKPVLKCRGLGPFQGERESYFESFFSKLLISFTVLGVEGLFICLVQ